MILHWHPCDENYVNGGMRAINSARLQRRSRSPGADLFADAQLVADAKADFRKQLNGTTYQLVIPEFAKPPLDCRRK